MAGPGIECCVLGDDQHGAVLRDVDRDRKAHSHDALKEVDVATPPQVFRRALAVNSTATSFAAKIPTVTRPFADGVIMVNGADTLEVQPFGAGSDNDTFDIRVTGWRKAVPSSPEQRLGPGGRSAFIEPAGGVLWIPKVICEISCTLSAIIGIAGAVAINTDRSADTLTLNKGVALLDTVVADSAGASFLCDVSGSELIEITFDMTGATNGNALVAFVTEGA
jgi:hypothetical protein